MSKGRIQLGGRVDGEREPLTLAGDAELVVEAAADVLGLAATQSRPYGVLDDRVAFACQGDDVAIVRRCLSRNSTAASLGDIVAGLRAA